LKKFVPFTKLHGTCNDFVLFDQRETKFVANALTARFVCDRRRGVGADGLLIALPSDGADVRMRILNADGSEAQMCGNGIRCVAAYLSESGAPSDLRIETLAGVVLTHAQRDGDHYRVRVRLEAPRIEQWSGRPEALFVHAGNPHVVLFAALPDEVDLESVGPEVSAGIAGGANVHVVTRTGAQQLTVRHWERGVGSTAACGTGAVAAAAAAITRGDVHSPVELSVPGGRLSVEWDGGGYVWLTGAAVRVFDGSIAL